jgi:prevent-host-death family protein
MEETIPASEANRKFSNLLRAVREGRASYVVTAHGRPVAKIIPVGEHHNVAAGARAMLLARLRSQPVIDIGPWTRDELYDDVR